MRKKVSIITMLMAVLIMVSGCGAGKKPDTVVTEFVEAMKNLDIETMSSKMSADSVEDHEDMQLFSDEDKEDPMKQYLISYLESNAKEITYKIGKSVVDGDSALVSVDFEYINAGPLFENTLGEFMKRTIGLMFQEEEPTDEELSEMFVETMEEQSEIIKQPRVEKTIDFKCIKKDKDWYIEDLDEEVFNVIMSNIISIINEIDESMGTGSITEEDELEEDMNIIEVATGEEIELATLKMQVNSFEEVQAITSEYGDDLEAKEGTKFLLVNMDITNITKSEIDAPESILLVDSDDREFQSYDSLFVLDDYLMYRGLAPSIKETGTYMYELPEDSSDYYLTVRKAETDDVYRIYLD